MPNFIRAIPGLYKSVIYTDDTGKSFRFSGGTRAWRYHNPGNIRPSKTKKRDGQIGIVNNFVVFSSNELGRLGLIEVIKIKYSNSSISQMMEKFAPRTENDTDKYIRFLRKKTRITDKRKIKDLTAEELELLVKSIEQFEGYKAGTITEVYQITKVRKDKKGKKISTYYTEPKEWLAKNECLDLARQGKVELEICIAKSKTSYLRTPPKSLFQECLHLIIEKLPKIKR